MKRYMDLLDRVIWRQLRRCAELIDEGDYAQSAFVMEIDTLPYIQLAEKLKEEDFEAAHKIACSMETMPRDCIPRPILVDLFGWQVAPELTMEEFEIWEETGEYPDGKSDDMPGFSEPEFEVITK